MNISSRTLGWLLLIALSIGSILFSIRYFSTAFPIVHLNIAMDRTAALARARELAQKLNWHDNDYDQAISFITDTPVKTFIELEGGGTPAFIAMMESHRYEPYLWAVRHFKEGETHESTLYFTPEGMPYGFEQELADTTPGADLPQEQARAIAETFARDTWHVDLHAYKAIEYSKEIQPSKRVDHTFVYEMLDTTDTKNINDHNQDVSEQVLYRLTIIVSGNTVTTLKHWVKIPHAFLLRYQELRSTNATIALTAELLMIFLYVICCSLIGLIILTRARMIIWRTPLACALVLAFLQGLTQLNELPLAWASYDTALPVQNFVWHYMSSIIESFLMTTFLLTILFIVAEGLTRVAFGAHVQLWRIWSLPVASSWSVLGQTIGGYLVVPIDLALGVGFYMITTRYFGWWTPSEPLTNPNILATYVPWLSPFVMALMAGVREECLFRAIPLASAALLAKRFGRKRLIMTSAFIMQALIFGAAHATYAQQPAYARLVELFIPSCILGALYLRYGLLPAIISHGVFDVVCMSMPLFIATAPRAWIHQAITIALALMPLLVIMLARLRIGHWTSLRSNYRNNSWQPPHTVPTKKWWHKEPSAPATITLSKKQHILVYTLGLIGIFTWLGTSRFAYDAGPMTLTRAQAIECAHSFLTTNEGITLDDSWTPLAKLNDAIQSNAQHQFIWQQEGKELYHQLLGTYLSRVHWIVRFVKPYGNTVERAYEHFVYLNSQGHVTRIVHKEPESAPGAQLDEDAARIKAHTFLRTFFNLDPATLKEIKAQSTQLPDRRDWQFIFEDSDAYPSDKSCASQRIDAVGATEQQSITLDNDVYPEAELAKDNHGQALAIIMLNGDRLGQAVRGIETPQAWDRQERSCDATMHILHTACNLLLLILLFIALNLCARNTTKTINTASARLYLLWTMFLFAFVHIMSVANVWPSTIAQFDMAQPWKDQLYALIGSIAVSTMLWALLKGNIFGLYLFWRTPQKLPKNSATVGLGISIGFLIAGAFSSASFFLGHYGPLVPNYNPAQATIGALQQIIQTITPWIWATLIILMAAAFLHLLFNHFLHRIDCALSGIVLFTFLYMGTTSMASIAPSISIWLLSSVLVSLVSMAGYYLVIRYDHALVPIVTATPLILYLMRQCSSDAYPTVMLNTCLTIIVLVAFAYTWFMYLNSDKIVNVTAKNTAAENDDVGEEDLDTH